MQKKGIVYKSVHILKILKILKIIYALYLFKKYYIVLNTAFIVESPIHFIVCSKLFWILTIERMPGRITFVCQRDIIVMNLSLVFIYNISCT